jgi:hypothetical protein
MSSVERPIYSKKYNGVGWWWWKCVFGRGREKEISDF